jgi:hypothetical protein
MSNGVHHEKVSRNTLSLPAKQPSLPLVASYKRLVTMDKEELQRQASGAGLLVGLLMLLLAGTAALVVVNLWPVFDDPVPPPASEATDHE